MANRAAGIAHPHRRQAGQLRNGRGRPHAPDEGSQLLNEILTAAFGLLRTGVRWLLMGNDNGP